MHREQAEQILEMQIKNAEKTFKIAKIMLRIARSMGIRVRNRSIIAIAADIERYIECSTYKKHRNPVGVLTPHA